MNPARIRFHSSSEPSSADHSDRTLKNRGVSRLEFSATYARWKSFASRAASIEPLAAAITANRENAEVRALSTSRGRPRTAPATDATMP